MDIRQATKNEYPAVIKHYEICGYRGGAQDGDLVFIAIEDKKIIGAVRICRENNEKVLRGMYIHPEFRNGGIGIAMLQFINEQVDLENCYCLPYAHLQNFYGKIGFREITVDKAPAFLAERLVRYAKSNSSPITIMKHF